MRTKSIRRRPDSSGRAGFALAVVVFLLFAVVVASATGYAVVSLESDMSVQGGEATEAMQIAEAGIQRFFGEHLGLPVDTTVYAIGDGTAHITARRVAPVDSADGRWLWSVRSEGRVLKLRSATAPATAVVQQQAVLHEEPIARTGALIASYTSVDLEGSVVVRGDDVSGGGCPVSGENTFGIAGRGAVTTACKSGFICPQLDGTPAQAVALGSHAAVIDTAGVRWDILTDPAFPVDHVNSIPGWVSDWPVIRWEGDLTAGSSHSGRGVLIVTGEFALGGCCFTWDGIVLAGEIDSSASAVDAMFLWGMLVGGLNGGGGALLWDNLFGPRIYFDACSALSASNALAYFEPLADTFEEVR